MRLVVYTYPQLHRVLVDLFILECHKELLERSLAESTLSPGLPSSFISHPDEGQNDYYPRFCQLLVKKKPPQNLQLKNGKKKGSPTDSPTWTMPLPIPPIGPTTSTRSQFFIPPSTTPFRRSILSQATISRASVFKPLLSTGLAPLLLPEDDLPEAG